MRAILFIALFTFVAVNAPVCAQKIDKPIEFAIGSTRRPVFDALLVNCDSSFAHATVTLSDGSRWVIKNKSAEQAGREISQNWWIGEDMRVKKDPDVGFLLRSVHSPLLYGVELDQSSSMIYSIDQIDENGYAILSSDGSQWAVGWLGSFSAQSWSPGDRIVINKSHYHRDEDYLMINLRNNTSCWTSLISWK